MQPTGLAIVAPARPLLVGSRLRLNLIRTNKKIVKCPGELLPFFARANLAPLFLCTCRGVRHSLFNILGEDQCYHTMYVPPTV